MSRCSGLWENSSEQSRQIFALMELPFEKESGSHIVIAGGREGLSL